MRRFLPKSLLGQTVLAVAVALLVAQVLAGVLIYRAEWQRREAALVAGLAVQLVGASRAENDERFERRVRRTGRRIERAPESPIRAGEHHDSEREVALTRMLAEYDVSFEEVVVFTRPIRDDAFLVDRLRRGIFPSGSTDWNPNSDALIAGLKRVDEPLWLVARVQLPDAGRGALLRTIVQTLIIYAVLVFGLSIVLRRMSRPLAALTRRVDRFAGRREDNDPLEPTGPEDTRRLITAHNAMEARIAALIDEKDVMLGAIGHDLKTPLAALRVRIESVENDDERARMAASIDDIAGTLDDILSLARIGRSSEAVERTNLAALLASVVDEYEDLGHPVELGETPRIAMNLRASWLRRAIRNLADNALRYGDRARISLERKSGTDGHEEAVITVEDDGPGIAEEEIAAMLEPFARGDASRNRATGGAGLGLTLARAIAEQHGGRLAISNRRDEGGKVLGLIAQLRLPLD